MSVFQGLTGLRQYLPALVSLLVALRDRGAVHLLPGRPEPVRDHEEEHGQCSGPDILPGPLGKIRTVPEIVSWILAQALKHLDTGKNKNMKRRADALVKSRQLLIKFSSPFLKRT